MLRSFYANRAAVFFIIVATIITGIVAFNKLPVALYPPTAKPKIEIRLDFFQMDRDNFKDVYGKPLESKLLIIPGVEEVNGWYSESSARWTVEFKWGLDEDEAKNRIEAITNGIKLADEWSEFRVAFSHQNGSIYISISSETLSSDELYNLVADRLKNRIEKIQGAENSFLSKPTNDYVRISLQYDVLISLNISPDDVYLALTKNKYDTSLGTLEIPGGKSFEITTARSRQTINELKDVVISERGSRPIKLSDVAEIEWLSEAPKWLIRGNGSRGLIAGATPKPDVNIAQFCDNFEKLVKDGINEIDPKIKVDILVNPSYFISEAIENLGQAVLAGMLIATIVLFLFLSSLWHTIVIAIAIPLSLFGGFIAMNMVGMELNLISLGAMALAVGMVVDGSIVVLENIVRHFQEKKPEKFSERLDTTIAAVWEVKNAIIASLLTTIIVFAPLMFTAPLAYAILGDLAKVIVCVLIISVFVTLLIVPPMMVKSGYEYKKIILLTYLASKFQQMISWAMDRYEKTLDYFIRSVWRRRFLYVFISIIFVFSIVLLLTQVRREIMAEPDSDKVWLTVMFEEQKELKDSEEKIIPYEQIIAKEFGHQLTHFFTSVWMSGGSILCNLKDKSMLNAFKKTLEERFVNTPEVKFYIEKWTPSALRLPNPSVVRVRVEGLGNDEKLKILEKLSEVAEKVEGVGHAKSYPSVYIDRNYKLHFDDVLLAIWKKDQAELWKNKIEHIVNFSLTEKKVKDLVSGSELVPVKIGLPKHFINSSEELGNLLIRIDGMLFPLRHFANIKEDQRFGQIYTERGSEEAKLEVKQKESFTGKREELTQAVMTAIETSDVDKKHLIFDDTETEISENINSLLIALLMALVLIWIVISLQFGKVRHVLIIMLAIPLGLIGVALSLYFLSSTLSVNSMLGMILLCGTAVNNSIIFIDFYNQSIASFNLDVRSHILRTARLRFKPILITTMTTILGMLPIAFGFGHGGEILQPLGIAVCGGLGVSTFLTLLVIPLVLFSSEPKDFKKLS